MNNINVDNTNNEKSIIAPLPGDDRLTTLPIGRPNIWKYYDAAKRLYWVPSEIDMSEDMRDYERMSKGEQRCVREILGFFATGDGIVNINLAERFKKEIKILEVGYFYDYQLMMENIHAETYALQLITIIPEVNERINLLNSINNNPAIALIAKWMYDTINSNEPLSLRLLRMACVEGLFFSGCFCLIYWFASRKLMPGLTQANMLIARDEGLHTDFALHLFTLIQNTPPTETIHKIFMDAVTIAKAFVEHMMPEPMPEMNSELMLKYIRYLTDDLLISIDQPTLYNITENPMIFMDSLSIPERVNFFERRSTHYSKQASQDIAVINNAADDTERFSEDF